MSEQIQSQAVIQQLNLSYNIEQDRMLFRVGMNDDSELALWLTMRMAKLLMTLLKSENNLPSADNEMKLDEPAAEAAQFEKEAEAVETLENMDFKTEYQPRKSVRNEGELLATNIELLDDGAQYLNITCLEGLAVRINLNQALIIAICNMLRMSAKEAGWDIGSNIAPTMNVDVERPELLH